jgi:hypothetical protein
VGDNKGPFNVKCFVRELGVLLKNEQHLRVRDVWKIYQRIIPLSKDNFINIFSRKQK